MLRQLKRKVVLALGMIAISAVAVACAGSPQVVSTTDGFQATIGGLSFRTPALTLPFAQPAPAQATTQSALQGAVHSGEACPIALPQ